MAALREREAALLTVQSIEEDLEKRRRAAAALEEAGSRRCSTSGVAGCALWARPPALTLPLSSPCRPASLRPPLSPARPTRVGGDAAKQRKAAQLQADVAALEAALTAARAEYGRVKQRNEQELERTRGERAAEYARLVRGFADVNAQFAGRCAEIWREVAAEFPAAAGGGRGGGRAP